MALWHCKQLKLIMMHKEKWGFIFWDHSAEFKQTLIPEAQETYKHFLWIH